ncbi:MAG: hypothetical protein FWD31_08980 [Planctomycetaceae bacterium]|nr:hypothetical protein [Planctomycetaceae bacterium]
MTDSDVPEQQNDQTQEVNVSSGLPVDAVIAIPRNVSVSRDYSIAKHESRTASQLAFTFAYVLAGAIAVHYVVLISFFIASLYAKDSLQIEPFVECLQATYNVWLPALVGIVSSVTTYYFTRERK